MIQLLNSRTTELSASLNGQKRFAVDASIGARWMIEDGVAKTLDATLDASGRPKCVPYTVTPFWDGMPGFHYKSKQSGEFVVRLKQAYSDVSLVAPRVVAPRIEGNRIIWPNFYADTDLILQFGLTSVSLMRNLKTLNAPKVFDIEIEAYPGIAQLMKLQSAYDADGQELAMVETPIIGGRTETLVLPAKVKWPVLDATTINESVGASADDDFAQRYSSGSWSNTGTWSSAGSGGSAATMRGGSMRFTGISIPVGATVDVAYVTFIAQWSYSGTTCNTELCCENSQNPGQISNYADHIGRSRTDDVVYDGVPPTTDGTPYQLPSIVDPVQQVVDDQSGTGDALIVFWEDRDNRSSVSAQRVWATYENTSYDPPAIHIEYTAGGAPTVRSGGSPAAKMIAGKLL